jgi:hypothetical protein
MRLMARRDGFVGQPKPKGGRAEEMFIIIYLR